MPTVVGMHALPSCSREYVPVVRFQVLLQVLIIATGNYNFFNLLTIALSLSLLDNAVPDGALDDDADGATTAATPTGARERERGLVGLLHHWSCQLERSVAFRWLCVAGAVAASWYSCAAMFSIVDTSKLSASLPWWHRYQLRLDFSTAQFNHVMDEWLPAIVASTVTICCVNHVVVPTTCACGCVRDCV